MATAFGNATNNINTERSLHYDFLLILWLPKIIVFYYLSTVKSCI